MAWCWYIEAVTKWSPFFRQHDKCNHVIWKWWRANSIVTQNVIIWTLDDFIRRHFNHDVVLTDYSHILISLSHSLSLRLSVSRPTCCQYVSLSCLPVSLYISQFHSFFAKTSFSRFPSYFNANTVHGHLFTYFPLYRSCDVLVFDLQCGNISLSLSYFGSIPLILIFTRVMLINLLIWLLWLTMAAMADRNFVMFYNPSFVEVGKCWGIMSKA